jgi:hypothetical protein
VRPVDAFVVRAARLAGVAAGLAGSVARQTEEADLARAARIAASDAVVLIAARERGAAAVARTGRCIDGRVGARAIGPRIAVGRRCIPAEVPPLPPPAPPPPLLVDPPAEVLPPLDVLDPAAVPPAPPELLEPAIPVLMLEPPLPALPEEVESSDEPQSATSAEESKIEVTAQRIFI